VLPILFVYGAIDERTQPLVNRTCDIRDWYMDSAGAVAGVAIMAALRRFSRGAASCQRTERSVGQTFLSASDGGNPTSDRIR